MEYNLTIEFVENIAFGAVWQSMCLEQSWLREQIDMVISLRVLNKSAENISVSINPRGFVKLARQCARNWDEQGFAKLMEIMAELDLDLDGFDHFALSPAMACAGSCFGAGLALCVKMGCDLTKKGRGGKSAESIARAMLDQSLGHRSGIVALSWWDVASRNEQLQRLGSAMEAWDLDREASQAHASAKQSRI